MTMHYDFSGRMAVVTGGARGIGRAITERFLVAGAEVAIWDIDATALAATRDALGADRLHGFIVDQSDEAQVEQAAAATRALTGRIDMLVNNAAIQGSRSPLWTYPVSEWRRLLDVNLTGQFLCCRAVVPVMLERSYGRVVNMTSLAGKEGHANFAAYSAAKAGILALTKSLSKDVAEHGIIVNAIGPGTIESESLATVPPDVNESILSRTPMRRFGTLAEVAALAAWLCSDEITFTTGALFDISGGRTGYQ